MRRGPYWRAKILMGVVSGVLLAFVTSAALPAYSYGGPPDDPGIGNENAERGLTRAEEAKANRGLGQSGVVGEVMREHGGKFGEWRTAEIEGQSRGAYAFVTLDEPTVMKAKGIRPDLEALVDRYTPGADIDHGHGHAGVVLGGVEIDIDHGYPLEEVTLIEQSIERFVVVVDLPTERVISFMPAHADPTEPPQLARRQSEQIQEPFIYNPRRNEAKGGSQ